MPASDSEVTRGQHVQQKEPAALRQGWRDGGDSASTADISGLPEPHPVRQGAHTPDAQALDASQPHRLWSTPGRARDTMFPSSSPAHLSGAAGRRIYREGGRKFVLFPDPVKNPNVAFNLDALLAEQSADKRLGKTASKLSLPVHIWYLWSSTGIKSGTSENGKQATGIKYGTCGGVLLVPQVPDMNHSY